MLRSARSGSASARSSRSHERSRMTRVLILDEPTAALSHQEVEALFSYLRRLRDRGVAIIYITHRLDEVGSSRTRSRCCGTATWRWSARPRRSTGRALVSAMIGRTAAAIGRPGRTGRSPRAHDRVSRRRHRGSVRRCLVLRPPRRDRRGLRQLGSGSAELVDASSASTSSPRARWPSAAIRLSKKGPNGAIELGVGFVPADRKSEAIFPFAPSARTSRTLLAAPVGRPSPDSPLGGGQRVQALAHELQIRSRNDPMQQIITLSGGNQQKVVLARWLECGTPVLLMVEPTRGVDVGARAELYRSMRELARQGIAILISTSDYEEVVQVADRAFVLARGKLVASLEGDAITTAGCWQPQGVRDERRARRQDQSTPPAEPSGSVVTRRLQGLTDRRLPRSGDRRAARRPRCAARVLLGQVGRVPDSGQPDQRADRRRHDRHPGVPGDDVARGGPVRPLRRLGDRAHVDSFAY